MIQKKINSSAGIALRFLWANRAITISSILTVAFSIAMVLTLANLFANTQTSIDQIRELAQWVEQVNPAQSVELVAEYEHAQSNLGPLRAFIIVLSGLTLLISSLLAISNFGILHQRCRTQFAIMRGVGATPQDLAKIGYVQAAVITAIGASIGLVVNFAVFDLSRLWFEEAFAFSAVQGVAQFSLNFGVVIQVLLLCAALTFALLMIPSIKLAQTVPVDIDHGLQQTTQTSERTIKSIILTLVLAGLSFIALSLLDNLLIGDHVTVAGAAVIPDNTFTVLLGTPLLIAALFMLLPFVLPPLLDSALPLFRKLIGNTSYVAIKNLIPQIRKSALMILLVSAVIMSAVFGSTFLETVRRGEHYNLTYQFPTEFILTGPEASPSTADASQLSQDLLESPAIDQVNIVSSNERTGAGPFLLGIQRAEDLVTSEVIVADIENMARQGLLPETNFMPSQNHDSLIISWRMASFSNLWVGDVITFEVYDETAEEQGLLDVSTDGEQPSDTASGTVRTSFEIVDVLHDFPGYGPYFWLVADSQSQFFQQHPDYVSVEAVYIHGEDDQAIMAHLAQVMPHYPDLTLNRFAAAVESSDQTFFQMWSIVIVVTLVLLLSSVVGVFNTLMSHINQKRKEYAILRTQSVTEKGIAKIILTQVMLYVLIGLVFGGVLGVLLTYLLIIMDPTQVYFNVLLLASIAVVLVLLTFVTFTVVARRAAKLKPIEELGLD